MTNVVEEVQDSIRRKRTIAQYFRQEILQVNFYRAHVLYFVLVTLLASVIVFGEGLANDSDEIHGGSLRFIDALFLCCSAMTTTGLNVVNLSDLTAFQQAILAILFLVGNIPFVSTFVVLVRRHFFRRKFADVVDNSRSGRKALENIETEEFREENGLGNDPNPSNPVDTGGSNSDLRRRRRSNKTPPTKQRATQARAQSALQSGFGFLPAPWEIEGVRRILRYPFRTVKTQSRRKYHEYLSFEPALDKRGRIRSLNEHERSELGGVEYRALNVLLWILCFYQGFWLTIGIVFLVPYAYQEDVTNILWTSQPGKVNPGFWGFYVAGTSFANCGMNIINTNFIHFRSNYFILTVVIALTVAGNTQFPIFLRLTIWTLSKAVPKTSRLRQTLMFLLHHPRRCFIYLFPARETWILVAIQVIIELVTWVLFEILNLGIGAVMAIPPGERIYSGLFQACGLRTSGAYIIDVRYLAPALLISYVVTMYISNFPIVMALRQTNMYEERSIGLDHDNIGGGGLAAHLRWQLAYDIWFQILGWFLICIIERASLTEHAPGFSVFYILFEVTSAYGTVGLSTGIPDEDYSLSAKFHTLSKLVMVLVMLRGRQRGLPLAIDRSILLPGQDLMKKMDREYDRDGGVSQGEEKSLRWAEQQSGARGLCEGEALREQDPQREEDDDDDGES